MSFDKSDKIFAIKISILLTVLALGVFFQNENPTQRNIEQDVIQIKNNAPMNSSNVYSALKSTEEFIVPVTNQ